MGAVDVRTAIDVWVSKARELRADMFVAEATFMLYLVDGRDVIPWRDVFTSYEELLQSMDLVTVSRYVAFRDALPTVGVDKATEIGVDGVIKAGRVEDTAKRANVIASLSEARARKGYPLSREETVRVVQQIAPVERMTRDLKRIQGRSDLEVENRELRQQVKMLTRQVAEKEKEIVSLKKEVASLAKRSGKTHKK